VDNCSLVQVKSLKLRGYLIGALQHQKVIYVGIRIFMSFTFVTSRRRDLIA
jgi:hypothetical protein